MAKKEQGNCDVLGLYQLFDLVFGKGKENPATAQFYDLLNDILNFLAMIPIAAKKLSTNSAG